MDAKSFHRWFKPDKKKIVAFLFVSFLIPIPVPLCSFQTLNCYTTFPIITSPTIIADSILWAIGTMTITTFPFSLILYLPLLLISYLLGCTTIWCFDKRKKKQLSKLADKDWEILRKYKEN